MGGDVTEHSAKDDNSPRIEHGEQDADCHTRRAARIRAGSATADMEAIDSDSGKVILSEALAFDGWDELWATSGTRADESAVGL